MAAARDKRKSGRLSELKPTSIILKGVPVEVHDISSEGIGVHIQENGPKLTNGERLEKIPIPLEQGTVHLRGIVTHISVTSKSKVCGIMFLFEGNDFKHVMQFKKERIVKKD